jgi:hypothetical protein
MQLGSSLPTADIGTGPTVVRNYAQPAEGLGYTHLVAPIACSGPIGTAEQV